MAANDGERKAGGSGTVLGRVRWNLDPGAGHADRPIARPALAERRGLSNPGPPLEPGLIERAFPTVPVSTKPAAAPSVGPTFADWRRSCPAMGRSRMFGAKAWVISYFEDVNRST